MRNEIWMNCFSNQMETLTLFFFFSLTFFSYTASYADTCRPFTCGITEPVVRFPFRLKDQQDDRCGYPGFDLSCNNNSQTVLTLPSAGEFTVTHIDYSDQWISINDPDYCLPKRALNFTVSDSPFEPAFSKNYTFLNCSARNRSEFRAYQFLPVFCLSTNRNFTVLVTDSDSFDVEYVPPSCRNMSTVSIPADELALYQSSMNPIGDLQLVWSLPSCRDCEVAGGFCGFKSDAGMEIGCSNLPTRHGLPRSAKYGITIGAGILGLVCLIGLACYACTRISKYNQQRQLDLQLSNWAMNPRPVMIVTGLDGPTIESYPKTVLGQSRRLPEPNDGTCSICLCEYQPKETLRTIPECNHYFHANCIDEWLRMNVTCPLCRNSPGGSSSMPTPYSSMSLSSLSPPSSSSP